MEKFDKNSLGMNAENNNFKRNNYYVYEWFTKDEGKVFYVGKGIGNRYKHILWDMNRDRGLDYKKINELHGIDFRIVKSDLTEDEALELELQQIKKRENEGEILIQFVDSNSYWDGLSKEEDKLNNEIRPSIFIRPVMKRYFLDSVPFAAYDAVDKESLMMSYFHIQQNPISLKYKKEIQDYIIDMGGKIFSSKAKKSRNVIEFWITTFENYIEYKELGYKIFHCYDVLKYIRDNPLKNDEKRQRDKSYSNKKVDLVVRDEFSLYLKSIQNEIICDAKNFEDGFEPEMRGIEFKKQKDYKNAIKYFEISMYLDFDAPALYDHLTKIYRRFGLFEEELRVLEKAIKVVVRQDYLTVFNERIEKIRDILSE
ncbi:MAG: hypothetical protein EOM50_02145 [Erysipelotrichia bacterium]|nr:hypothetical protein [Erysipelotrichia bacterium]